MPTPSWNLAIIIVFLMGIAFGYILQREKIVATLLSIYVSLIVTQAVSGSLINFFQGQSTLNSFWINTHASPFAVRTAVFLAVIVLMTAKTGISGGKSKGIISPIEIAIYSIFTTGLLIGSIFYFMPAESRDAFAGASRMGSLIINYYVWWIVLPVLTLIGTSFFRKGSSSSD